MQRSRYDNVPINNKNLKNLSTVFKHNSNPWGNYSLTLDADFLFIYLFILEIKIKETYAINHISMKPSSNVKHLAVCQIPPPLVCPDAMIMMTSIKCHLSIKLNINVTLGDKLNLSCLEL